MKNTYSLFLEHPTKGDVFIATVVENDFPGAVMRAFELCDYDESKLDMENFEYRGFKIINKHRASQ